MAPEVVIVINAEKFSNELITDFMRGVKNRYDDNVLVICTTPDCKVDVYGAQKINCLDLSGIADLILKQLNYDQQQELYEQLHRLNHRIR